MMKNSVVIKIDPIGPVLFERSCRVKSISLSVRPDSGVRVAVSPKVSLEQAEKFVRKKMNWVHKHLRKIKQAEEKSREFLDQLPHYRKIDIKYSLSKRINLLAEKYGFAFNRISFRNQKSRWGSCSARNNISLNLNLIYLPQYLVDYVLIHELMHTRIKNHGKFFWEAMDGLVGDAKQLDFELKKYNLLLLRNRETEID